MRISEIRKISKLLDQEEPVFKHCNNCRIIRVELHLQDNPHSKMLICTNIKCFHYTDITKLITWVR